jgi:quercetin dioxygenase-like cupin family protein
MVTSWWWCSREMNYVSFSRTPLPQVSQVIPHTTKGIVVYITSEDARFDTLLINTCIIAGTKPGGRTGWHSHPGLLLITLKDGSVDFYDKDCGKHTYTAGQSFTEGAEPHNVVNSGSGNARLLVAYIVKSGEPRRIEDPQPRCGEALQLR